jgi:hypothetical protein
MFPESYFPSLYFPPLYFSEPEVRGNYYPHSYFTELHFTDLYFPGNFTVPASPPPQPPVEEQGAIGGLFRHPRRIPGIHGFTDLELPRPALDAIGFVVPASIRATFKGTLPVCVFSASGQTTVAAISGDWMFTISGVELSATGSGAPRQAKRIDLSDEDEQFLLEHYMLNRKGK